MRAGRIGSVLLALGALVGAAAGVGLLVGFEPARLPAALLNIAAYKLTFLASAGLLAAGALVFRYTRRENAGDTTSRVARKDARELAEGQSVEPALTEVRRREPVRDSPNAREQ